MEAAVAKSRFEAAYRQASNLPPTASISPIIITILEQLAGFLLSACVGGAAAKDTLNAYPKRALRRARREVLIHGYGHRKDVEQLAQALVIAGTASSAQEMDSFEHASNI